MILLPVLPENRALVPGKPQTLSPGDGPLSPAFQQWWWPLSRALGFRYHHAWAAVVQTRLLCESRPLVPGSSDQALYFLSCLVLAAESDGHVCLPVQAIADMWTTRVRSALEEAVTEPAKSPPVPAAESLVCPVSLPRGICRDDPELQILFQPALPGGTTGDCFHTRRSLGLETRLAARLRHLMAPTGLAAPEHTDPVATCLVEGTDPDQREALYRSRGKRFFILSGGPGTGKTTLAKRMTGLFALDHHSIHGTWPRIVLCAPTGRAASRLGQSFQDSLAPGSGLFPPDLLEPMTRTATTAGTLHRLLSELSREGNPEETGPDLVLVDEASMVDMHLMHRLLEVLPEKTALWLLGDHHQLPSVDSGAVLADLLDHATGQQDAPEAAWSTVLTRCHRSNPAIQALSEAVRTGQPPWADTGLMQPWSPDPKGTPGVFHCTADRIRDVWLSECAAIASRVSGKTIAGSTDLRRLYRDGDDLVMYGIAASLAILTPVHDGPGGTRQINQTCRDLLHMGDESTLPPGLPVMVLKNDPVHEAWNGDRGVIAVPRSGGPRVFRASADTPAGDCPSMVALASWESSFALTIHKSQGSEFSTVILVLPPGSDPMLSRELVYTGMTRARQRLVILASAEEWSAASERHTRRHSRLKDLLRN